MKYLKCRAELGQEGAKPDPEIYHEFAGWQQSSSWLVSFFLSQFKQECDMLNINVKDKL